MEVFFHYRCRMCNHYFMVPTDDSRQAALEKALSRITNMDRLHDCNESQAGITEMIGVSWKEAEKK